ncbi:MAG: hypothetical protein WCA24_00745 [Thiomonas sp.]
MKPTPPNHVILPVLTERLQPTDAVNEEDIAEPFEVQPSAYAHAVYRGPEQPPPLLGEMTGDLDQIWTHIAPVLQQQLLELVYAEFDTLAPQLADRLFVSLKPALRASLAEALKQQ